jgi:hypothetical protein
MRALFPQNSRRFFFGGGIAYTHPQHNSAARQLLLNPRRMVVMDQAAKRHANQRAHASRDHRRYSAAHARQRQPAQRGKNRRGKGFRLQPGYAREECLPRHGWIVLNLPHLLVAVAQRALQGFLRGQH